MTRLNLDSRQGHTTDEVFGISRDLPLNYVDRTNVDEKLVENLTREKHIVIYGSSKQGKTSLRKHCLQESDYAVVQCSNKWGIEDILSNILKRAGFQDHAIREEESLREEQNFGLLVCDSIRSRLENRRRKGELTEL